MNDIKFFGDDGIGFNGSGLLHRYYFINEDLKKSLQDNYLWFSDPLVFNDPFDCNLEVCCNGTFEEILAYFCQLKLAGIINASNQSLIDRAGFLAANPFEMERLSKKQDMDTISKLGICCFSEKKDSLLMWSHYADKYKGLCLTFDITKDLDLFGKQLFAVEYPHKYPIHRFPADFRKFHLYRFLIATKSVEWAYEREVRIVWDHHNPPFRERIPFNKKALVGVTFGHKCCPKNQQQIIELFSQVGGYEHLEFYITKLKKLSFGVEFEEISK